MFQQLLESNAVFHPRIGGSVASTAGHVAAIAALVAFTATTPERPPESVERPIYIAPPPALPVSRIPSVPSASASPHENGCRSSCFEIARIALVEIPIGIPMVDLTRPVSGENGDFGDRNPVSPGGGIGAGELINSGEAFSSAQVDRPVVLRPGSPTPSFPDALREAGMSGGVMAEFVVDTLGRVEPQSVRFLTVDHEQFGAAVRRVLPRLRFMPAEVQGRKVRQLVRLPFRFDLHDLEGNSNLGLI